MLVTLDLKSQMNGRQNVGEFNYALPKHTPSVEFLVQRYGLTHFVYQHYRVAAAVLAFSVKLC